MQKKSGKKLKNQQITGFFFLILLVVLSPFLYEKFSLIPLTIGVAIVSMGILYIVGKLTKETE
ncbi:hypothetical protein QOZ98_003010 [Planomicrobium stackebrandtii]|uniref:Group-specific protein n=1 Tax=Planomicrobium stackebrandtii TaxID=253160 RepID=A0ABU0GXU0_9BACL|nr:hypothetical protein [Planomicrobium stackebrandtii]MDQ0430174.1 hypothetical protein [Planomicrobium stackebrandtii]